MKRKINKTLKNMKVDIEIWYDKSGRQWVLSGTNKKGNFVSEGTRIYRLNMYTYKQWIAYALKVANQ